jgi:hypothetical protein
MSYHKSDFEGKIKRFFSTREIRIIIIFISLAAVECKNHKKIVLQPIKFKTLLKHSYRPSLLPVMQQLNG